MNKRPFFLFLFLFFANPFTTIANQQEEIIPPKTLLVTGGAGFIGSNFLNFMFEKYPEYHFIVIDALTYAGSLDKIPKDILFSPRFTFIHDTINNPQAVDYAMSRSDWVVHFAAETHVTRSIVEDEVFFMTDILGTRVLLNAAKKYANKLERFVHISTSEVYGTAEKEPMDENHPLNPRSPYAAAKAGADRLVYSYCCTFDTPAVILRPFNNYGPEQHLEKLIPRLIVSAIRKEPLTIHGSGDQKRDWIFTEDTAKAIDAALHQPHFEDLKQQVINIGSGTSISVLEIAHKILEYFKLHPSFLKFIGDRPGQVECHISSTAKATELLNWRAVTSFDEGLAKTIEWYINHPEKWEEMLDDASHSILTVDGLIEEH